MDQKQKKSTRDLSDLKARLGLAKPGAAEAPKAQTPGPAGPTMQQAQPYQAGMPPGVVAPPGIAPPPGMQVAPAQPPPPDVRRDPFAQSSQQVAQSAQYRPQAIVDAGPPVEIPKEKKSNTKLAIALIVTALIPLVVGWACGRIYGARLLFNRTIEDAGEIHKEIVEIAKVNNQIAQTMAEASGRAQGKLNYDEKLLEELKDILRSSPDANQEKAFKRQEKLFRTNYAMMEGIVIDRLFKYFNNTIRLMGELESFIQKAEASKELIEAYAMQATEDRKYGIVFAEDAGSYYLAQLVEVGNIVCADEKAGERCKKEDIKGFYTRMGATGAWSPRTGKPGAKGKITEIVIPIIPDENWRQVAVGKHGYLAYNDYMMRFSRVSAIAALLAKEEKSLKQDLSKAANREKLLAPL